VYALVYVFIAVACLLVINGCLACCAVVSDRLRTCLAATFFAFNIAVFFAILAVGIYVLVRKAAASYHAAPSHVCRSRTRSATR